MFKIFTSTFAISSAVLFSPFLLANTQNLPIASEQNTRVQNNGVLEYAKACEEVAPQSPKLIELQQKIRKNPKQSKQILHSFWQNISLHGAPLVEPIDAQNSRVTFLWRGAKHNVRIIGGPSNDHEWLTRIAQTDIWFKETIVNNQFIGSYSFAVDVPNIDGYLSHYCPQFNLDLKESRTQRRAIVQVQGLDPYNPRHYLPLDNQSEMRNENYVVLDQAPTFINPQDNKDKPNPEVKSYTMQSRILGNQRKIQIYQSARKNSKQDYITAIFFDGQQYADLLNVPKALDVLVEQGKLPPIQAIFVSAPNDEERSRELTPNTAFTDFFGQELLPWIDQHAPNKRNKQNTVLQGSSLGGLSTAYLALNYPNEISHAVPLSGSFWWQATPLDLPNGMSKIIREQNNPPKQHWHISANSFETIS
ncbi:MAG: alpha/beta hydrolase-fold protein [Acinetobacter sp.]